MSILNNIKRIGYKVISLGLGQQSSVMYLMSSLGIIERADYAIFADTGAESKATYSFFEWLKSWALKNDGVPILQVSKGNLYQDLMTSASGLRKRFASIPAFVRNTQGKIGLLRRQCTNEYKVQEIFRTLRMLYELKPRQRMPPTEIWLGITLEEKERTKFSPFGWLTYVYPFLNLRTTKNDFVRAPYTSLYRRVECTQWLEYNGYPIPPKSACTFCPFQSNRRWLETRTNDPEEWKKLVLLDETIRHSESKGIKEQMYLHRSAVPLKDADLNGDQLDMFSAECSGVCGI